MINPHEEDKVLLLLAWIAGRCGIDEAGKAAEMLREIDVARRTHGSKERDEDDR